MGSILSWLDSLWNFFGGGISTLWHWILGAFKSIWSWVYQAFDALERDIVSVARSIGALAREIESWAARAVDSLYHLALKWVIDLRNWTAGLINKVAAFANDLYRWAAQAINSLIRAIDKAYSDIEHWVISQIWNPLYRFISGAVNWIEHEGAYIYDLITHPDKLVTLIEAYLWKAWLTWLQRLAIPIVTFILSNFRAVIPELISVAEDVLSRVL